MAGPLPEDLRRRVVDAWLNGEGTYAEVAARFKVSEASVDRWLSRWRTTGSVAPKPMGGSKPRPIVDEVGEAFLRGLLEEQSDSTLVELCAAYLEEYEVVVPAQRMSEVVARMGFTQKRGSSARGQLNGKTS